MTTTTPTSGPFNPPTVVAVNPLSTDIDWDEVELILGIRIVQSRLQREDVRNGAGKPRPKSHPIRKTDEPIVYTSPASIEQALASARTHLDAAGAMLDVAISGPTSPKGGAVGDVVGNGTSEPRSNSYPIRKTDEPIVYTSPTDLSSVLANKGMGSGFGDSLEHVHDLSVEAHDVLERLGELAARDRLAGVDVAGLGGELLRRLDEVLSELGDVLLELSVHDDSPSSVAGCSEGTGSVGSASDDPAEHRDRFAERIELLINRDAWDLAIEIVTLLAPGVRDAEKALAAKRLVDLVRLTGGAL